MARKYREGAKRFYKSKAWIKCRDGYMQSQHFICERCGGLATICHHKTWLDEEKYSQPEYSLNWDRLEALCHTCHNQEHFSSGIVSDGLTFDSKGNLIKNNVPPHIK
ncbi:HNH endonuclease [Jeotgalicoccus sp. S0W5]|uniref:HNH endonuclease n=1 Tax=Jeotgalicoccus sp. S0W5 TaxID=2527874 RepID=UPI001414D836|nr:HNH endonuclease [Jeotgalicoccus sp. S0W5]